MPELSRFEGMVIKMLFKINHFIWKYCFDNSFAESCTGGLCAARLISVPDASAVLDASVITYSNQSKTDYLGVNPDTVERFGVVSEEVALEMAEGVSLKNNADVGVGVTGIAGPTGGSADKPVGTVCFGFKVREKTYKKICKRKWRDNK